jgi:hypothetical protein
MRRFVIGKCLMHGNQYSNTLINSQTGNIHLSHYLLAVNQGIIMGNPTAQHKSSTIIKPTRYHQYLAAHRRHHLRDLNTK